MKTLVEILAVLLLAAPVHAGTKSLFTAPAPVALFGGTGVTCFLLNVGKNPITMTINVHDHFGTVTGTTSASVAPGTTSGFNSASNTDQYCEFQVTGSTKTVRASALYFNSTGYTMSIPAQ